MADWSKVNTVGEANVGKVLSVAKANIGKINELNTPAGGGGGYTANAVNFEEGEWLGAYNATGITNTKTLLTSFWFTIHTDRNRRQTMWRAAQGSATGGSNTRFRLNTSTNNISFALRNPGGSNVLAGASSFSWSVDTWYHLLFSCDLSDSGKRYLYIDDSAQSPSYTTYTNDVWDANQYWAIAARPDDSEHLDGCLADTFITNEYLDISVESNRRKFIDASGNPVDLGSDGSTPTGTQPLFFFKSAYGSAGTNSGSEGNFSVNGTLSACGSSPSD